MYSFTGMVSLYYGYNYGYFGPAYGLPHIEIDFSSWLMGSVVFTTILSLIGAFIAVYVQTRATFGILWNKNEMSKYTLLLEIK